MSYQRRNGHAGATTTAIFRPSRSTSAASSERFGVDATFHTCSATSLTLDGLLSFLIERGKVVEQEGQLMMNIAKMCNHG